MHNCMDCPNAAMLAELLVEKDCEIGKLNEELSDLKNSLPVLKNMYEKHPVGIKCVRSRE